MGAIKWCLVVLTIPVFFSSSANGQNKLTAWGVGLAYGPGFQDVSKMHDFLPNRVRDFSREHMLIGGMGYGMVGKLVLGGSGSGIIGDVIQTDSFKYSLGGGMGSLDLGYVVINRDKLKLYPVAGFGFGKYGLRVVTNRIISLSDILADPTREMAVVNHGFMLDLSLNLNIIPNITPKDDFNWDFMAGLKIGCLLGFPSSRWKFTGGDIPGGPRFGTNMIYARLLIGGTGINNQ